MPWWTWIVIWIALIALSLLFFVGLGVRLFRQFMSTVKELGDATDRFSRLPSAVPGRAGADPGGVEPAHAAPVPGAAVFAPPAEARQEHHAAKQARREARRARRVQRRTDRGQPRRLHDTEFS